MLDLFTDEEIINKLNDMNIEEIADYFENMNDYSYVKRHKNGIFIEMAARGWSDNEHFLSLLTHLLSRHRKEYVGYCDAVYWFVIDKKYKYDYRFEIVPFVKEDLKLNPPNDANIPTPKKILYQEIYDCFDCPYYTWSEWEDKGLYYVDCDIDSRTIESKEGFETKELFKSCRLDDYKEEDNERSEK